MSTVYQKTLARQNAYQTRMNREGRCIGEIPPPVDERRRDRCGERLAEFCKVYFGNAFPLPWSDMHLDVIARLEKTVRGGACYAVAMPRGSGKTTLAVRAAIWGVLYGYRSWIALIASTEPAAVRLLEAIKEELRFNARLAEDFPEVCHPVASLEGESRRCNQQTCTINGERMRTAMIWKADTLTLPQLPHSASCGATVSVAGLTGGKIRGQQRTTVDGHVMRPDVVILDDPQTRESAESPTQTESRLRTLKADILGLAGPDTQMAAIMPCTVISHGDLADQVLSRETHPEWHGMRARMLESIPKRLDLWDQYAEIWGNDLRNGGNGAAATEWYQSRQAQMDEGAKATWFARHPGCATAIEFAMRLRLQDEVSFASEYQNEPLEIRASELLTTEEICERQNGYQRAVVPAACDKVTAFIDVQQQLFYWVAVAWERNFRGYVIDYGTFPEQNGRHFRLVNARRTLQKLYPGVGLEGTLQAGLTELCNQLCSRFWTRDDGVELPAQNVLIDANWGQSRDAVYAFCRQSVWRAMLMPSHGKGLGASSQPLNASVTKKVGMRIGAHWRIDKAKDNPVQYVLFDANHWKTFVHARLRTEPGEPGSLTLYHADPRDHKTFAEHLRAEYPVRVESKQRTVDEWKLRPDRPDNHWFDCLVGASVAASIEGRQLRGAEQAPLHQPRKKMRFGQ